MGSVEPLNHEKSIGCWTQASAMEITHFINTPFVGRLVTFYIN